MCLERAKKKNYEGVMTRLRNGSLITFFKKCRSSHLRCSIKKLPLQKLLNRHRTNRKTPLLESLFNSEHSEIFKSNYFEEHLRRTASEILFIKLRKIKNYS